MVEIEKKDKVSSFDMGKFYIQFKNGTAMSIIFDECTYSDNHDKFHKLESGLKRDPLESTTVEIMFYNAPNKAIARYLERDEDSFDYDQIAGYVPVGKIPTLMRMCQDYDPKRPML
jgi:hypothetical protein